ncbi:glycerol kinase GlpK [Tsuneonella sp. HG222]
MQTTEPLILVLDEGTTSTRAMLFTAGGELRGQAQRELTQHYPRPGWVEHDAAEIWHHTLACAQEMVAAAGGAGRIACLGVTNQRETVVAWDRATGEPLSRAIVWQDRRTAETCAALRDSGAEDAVRRQTGLMLDPYFSATKMRWLLDNEPGVRAAADAGTLAFGTVESWLVWKLTGAHLTDAANASRTLLLALDGATWDEGLCDLFGVPRSALPEVVDNAGQFGTTTLFDAPIPVTGLAGDQQAATIGQGCLAPGDTKATFGTGAFVLANMGGRLPHSAHRLLGTVLAQIAGRRTYALEGSIFVAGSLFQWLRDSLGLIVSAPESEDLARSVPDSAGVVFVPALSGLGAPHWRAEARGLVDGLTFAATRAHVVRAALESVSHQTRDLAEAFAADGAPWATLRIDGGMSANDWLAQDLAGTLQVPVVRPDFVETTALGAAMLAAVGAGLHASLESAAGAMIGATRLFSPDMPEAVRAARLMAWRAALAKV